MKETKVVLSKQTQIISNLISIGFKIVEKPDFTYTENQTVLEKTIQDTTIRIIIDNDSETNDCELRIYVFDSHMNLCWDMQVGYGTPIDIIKHLFVTFV